MGVEKDKIKQKIDVFNRCKRVRLEKEMEKTRDKGDVPAEMNKPLKRVTAYHQFMAEAMSGHDGSSKLN